MRGLAFGGVLESAVLDGPEQLGLEEEVAESGAVDADVALLGLGGVGGGLGGGGVEGLVVVLLVVEQLLLVHVVLLGLSHPEISNQTLD